MAVDKLVDSGQLDSDLTSIANAIRTKGGTSAQLAFPNGFVSAVNALPVPVTPTIQSLTVTPTTSQQTFDSSSVDGYKPVTVNAIPSEYIIPSGSETKTANGTYDVTNLAQLIVNVAGGGGSGLEYETGTWEPDADIDRGAISFANSHTEAPVLVYMCDVTETAHSASNSNYVFMYADPYKLWGKGYPYGSSSYRYANAWYCYRSSSTSSISAAGVMIQNNSSSTSTSSSAYPRYWASPTDFHPYSNNASRYWRAGRTYKWIAVWKP